MQLRFNFPVDLCSLTYPVCSSRYFCCSFAVTNPLESASLLTFVKSRTILAGAVPGLCMLPYAFVFPPVLLLPVLTRAVRVGDGSGFGPYADFVSLAGPPLWFGGGPPRKKFSWCTSIRCAIAAAAAAGSLGLALKEWCRSRPQFAST